MWRYLVAPALLEAVCRFLRLPTTASDAHLCDVADTDIDLPVRFNLHWLGGGRSLRGGSVFLNSQIHGTLQRNRHDKTDVQRATRAREIVRQPAHRPE